MIPLRYREKVPRQWYETHVAETHFEAAGGEIDYQKERSKDIQNQFALPYATWGLDIWDWIYFGEKQIGSDEERREAVRRKNLAKARFTLPTLRTIGSAVGDLKDVEEIFSQKKITFHFRSMDTSRIPQLLGDFHHIRPVHVKTATVSIEPEEQMNAYYGSVATRLKIITIKPAEVN